MAKFIQKIELTKEQLIEKYRYVLVEDNDFSLLLLNKKEELEKIGFTNIDIKYTGFYNQGDGASITNRINFIDSVKLLCLPIKYKKYVEDVVFSIKRNESGYYHANTLFIENDLYLNNKLTIKAKRLINDYIRDIEKHLLDYIYNSSKNLYKQLELEYKFLTSDNVVFEYLITNKEIFGIEEIN